MILIRDKNRYSECKYTTEQEFETEIFKSCSTVFGKDAILIDAKKKIGSQALGNTIPDGFLFDLSDVENPEFYLIEIELEKHDFFNHNHYSYLIWG